MESKTPECLSIMVSSDGKTIEFIDAEVDKTGKFHVSFDGNKVSCVQIWKQTWVSGTELSFPTKKNPGWYFDILRQYTRIDKASAGPCSFCWVNDLPVFAFLADTPIATQAAFRAKVWTYLFDAAMKALSATPE